MFDQLEAVVVRFHEIEGRLADPACAKNAEAFRKLSQEHSSLQEIVREYAMYKDCVRELEDNRLLSHDTEFSQMAWDEIHRLEPLVDASRQRLRILLLPEDPRDAKNVVFEVRAGAGGDEAALFVGEIFRLYQKYAERQNWKVTVLSAQVTGLGGFREIIAEIEGQNVFSRLKWEAGVHRVQRVPETESQGRVHTSTVTVAVMPEASEMDVVIQPTDLRIDVYRSGGAGGQGVNTTDSAVRITHLPTNLVVVCQDERSQIKNKDKAMKILRSRLLEAERDRFEKSQCAERRSMVGTGDRSERIRTYNFPQGRLTDHRINVTLYQLSAVMEGQIDEIVSGLISHYQMEALRQQGIVG